MSSAIIVLGSIHMDLVVQAPRFPQAGESVVGGEFHTYPGGKGANRAVAAARLGAQVGLLGCLGDDGWGAELRAVLASEGVDVTHVVTRKNEPTGASLITVVPGGQTSTLSAPGANRTLAAEDVQQAVEALSSARVLVLHLGLPEALMIQALQLARKGGAQVLLHAVPAGDVSSELLAQVDVLVIQERSARALAGAEDDVSPSGLARRLDALGPGRVVITRGERGALMFDGERVLEQGPFAVEAVDSTATGAAFAGALAVALSEEARGESALRFACAAGALAAAKPGALPSLPTRDEVNALLE